jgi:hypothetical protein
MESNDESKQLLDKLNVFEEDIVNLLYHKKTRPFANFRNDRIFRLILHNSQFMEFAIQFANDFSPLAPDNPNDGAPLVQVVLKITQIIILLTISKFKLQTFWHKILIAL